MADQEIAPNRDTAVGKTPSHAVASAAKSVPSPTERWPVDPFDLDQRSTVDSDHTSTEAGDRCRCANPQVDRPSDQPCDPVTGLADRGQFQCDLAQIVKTGLACSVLLVDVDQFKVVNESLGRQAGDELLRCVAERLVGVCPESSRVARLGGDEFIILWPYCTPSDADHLARALVECMCEPLSVNGMDLYTSASVGVVHDEDPDRLADELIRDADIALRHAKVERDRGWQRFETQMLAQVTAEFEQQNLIRRAVQQMEFELHYQPYFDASTLEVLGTEALIRWMPPDGSMVPPNLFLPYLERSGLIVAVGDWVVRTALEQLASWRAEHPGAAALDMSVNLSRVQFGHAGLARQVARHLAETGIDAESLIVEVTETDLAQSPEGMCDTLDQLRALGVRVALDDFGVGQSSLGSLEALPFDIVKIDRCFIDRIGDGRHQAVTEAALGLARSTLMTTVAEGVETDEQRSWLADHGCDILQGFLLGHPVAPDQVFAASVPESLGDAAPDLACTVDGVAG